MSPLSKDKTGIGIFTHVMVLTTKAPELSTMRGKVCAPMSTVVPGSTLVDLLMVHDKNGSLTRSATTTSTK